MEGEYKNKWPGPDRVVGVSPSLENEILIEYAKSILNRKAFDFEFEKGSGVEILIYKTLERLSDFIKEYGAEKKRFIKIDQIHLIDVDDPETEGFKDFFEEGIDGVFIPFVDKIVIDVRKRDKNTFIHTIVHELVHANSFQSMTYKENGQDTENGKDTLSPRRIGFGIYDEESDEVSFKFLNEAITEEITKEYIKKYHPETIEEARKLENVPNDPIPEMFDQEYIEEPDGLKPVFSYFDERLRFRRLVNDIYKSHKNQFSDYKEIIKLFSKAMFTGRLLEVARLVEDTYGKGSFRRIGEITKEQVDILKELDPEALSI